VLANTHVWTYTYTIDIPDFTLPADGASTVNCAANATPPTPPAMVDACGNTITPVAGVAPSPLTLRRRHGLYLYVSLIALATPMYGPIPIRSIFLISRCRPDGASTVNCAADATPPTPPVMQDACW
jgi:hypothetical protein